MILDFDKGIFRAPIAKLKSIAVVAKTLLYRAASEKQWVSVKALASLAEKATFLDMAIPVARFFPPRAARCREDGEDLVGHRKGDLQAQARPGVVDKDSLPPQWSAHLETHRERISPWRLERFRMVSSSKQLRGV